jgi:glutaconate CoA-transferase subunit B
VVRDSAALRFLVTMSDGPNVTGALWCTEMREVMGLMQAGRVTLGFIGGAQVDRFGNLNTTYVGPPERALRLPGRAARRTSPRSPGATSSSWRTSGGDSWSGWTT